MKRFYVLFALVLVGCAPLVSNPSMYLPLPTAKDWTECRAYGRAHSPMNPMIAAELCNDCMQMKGYRKQ